MTDLKLLIERIDYEISQYSNAVTTSKDMVCSLEKIKATVQGLILKKALIPYEDMLFKNELRVIKQNFGYDFEKNEMYLVVDKNENVVSCLSGTMSAFQNKILAIKALNEYPVEVKKTITQWCKEFKMSEFKSNTAEINIRDFILMIKNSLFCTELTEKQITEEINKFLKGTQRMLPILVIGPYGSGKSSIAKPLSNKISIPYLSAYDILNNAETPLTPGCAVETKLIEEAITNTDFENGFVLEGYPNDAKQADAFNSLCEKDRFGKPLVIYLNIDEETLLNRTSSRKACKDCGEIYCGTKQPKFKDICDVCGGLLVSNEKDLPDNVHTEYKNHIAKTKPVIDLYKTFSDIATVIELNSADNISGNINKIIKKITM